MKVLLINGPNMNMLGKREPEIYGKTTLKEVETDTQQLLEQAGLQCLAFQSNSEGDIIDFLHQHLDADFTIINPGGLTHTSVVLRDALAAFKIPCVEVHISNNYQREKFRQHSFLSNIARAVLLGFGVQGYNLAAQFVIQQLCNKEG